MDDIYLDTITGAEIINGVVTITVGSVTRDGVDNKRRLRIPLQNYQEFVGGLRTALISFMKQGYYGEEGKQAAERLSGILENEGAKNG